MKKDIVFPEVEGVYMTVVKEKGEEDNGEMVWNVYLINNNPKELNNVLVSSKGYNHELKGEKNTSSVLRHFFELVPAKASQKVEPIIEQVFGLHNEFMVSYYLDKVLYDKKYIFLAETIKEENFTEVPVIKKQGILIK
jgi:hypothetical protein